MPVPVGSEGEERLAEAVDKLWFLKRIHVFRCLDEDALARVREMATRRRYERGGIIFGPDDQGDAIYLLEQGRVKLSRFDARGREIIMAILEEGEFFGEEALLDNERCNGYAEALESAFVCRITTVEFETLMEENSELALAVARQMSERLLGARDRIESLAFRDVPARLAGVLVELAAQHGESRPDGAVRIDLRITHQELANLIASTRETTTAQLSRLKREGLVKSDGRELLVTNLAALREAAGLG